MLTTVKRGTLRWPHNNKKSPVKPIPNINIGQVYDQRYSDAEVHYDKLGNLAGFRAQYGGASP